MEQVAKSIACLGLMVADIVGRPIDALPKKGTLDIIDRIELHIGGNAANTALALAKLGTPVAAFGRVGLDGFGDYMLLALERQGVDVRGIGRDPEAPTGATMVTVHSDAERSFIHVPGANVTYTADDVDWNLLGKATILHVAGLQLMVALEGEGITTIMQQARRRGIRTMLDTVMNPRARWWDGLVNALPFIDWLVPSEVEAVRLTGLSHPADHVARFREHGATNVVIKMGEKGCYVAADGESPFVMPAFPVEAVDSLGAGDSWSAGFLTGLLQGWQIEQTARFANAVGACCVQALGATTGVKSLDETVAFLATQGPMTAIK